MKRTLIIFSLIFMAQKALAARYDVQSFDASQCQGAGHTDEYILNICPLSFRNNDRVIIQGTPERSNLTVTRGDRNQDHYFMALGRDNATYSVEGPINFVRQRNLLGNMVRHALIYRLNYRHYDGTEGFQIITVRMGRGFNADSTTCTRFAFDSAQFSQYPVDQQEQRMREQALRQVQEPNFQSGSQRCMEYEHHEDRGRPATPPVDPNEGDSMETSHP